MKSNRLTLDSSGEFLRKNRRKHFLFNCVCGGSIYVQKYVVAKNNTKSCGCLGNHKMAGTPTHTSFYKAKNRCTNPNRENYKYYGGRGIGFKFKGLYELINDIGLRPDGKTLDRIDNEGHYEIGNVRWSTPKEQANNRRKR